MIKYKVSFEITNRVGDSLMADGIVNKDLLIEKLKEYQENYKGYVEQAINQGTDKIEVTDFRIEEVQEND